jgi:hypothetical protein
MTKRARSAVQNLLQELAPKQPSAGALSPAAVADVSFLDELERMGFIRKLYAE